MLERTIPITDHRGHPFTLWSGALLPTTDAESKSDARHARRIVWKNIDPASKTRIRWLLVGVAIFVIGISIPACRSGFWHARSSSLYWSFWLCASIYTTWRTSVIARSASICTDLLNRHLCPACGYKLDGLSPDPDGCTTCPECSAAWKTPPP